MDVWPLRPNWRDAYRVTYEFRTEVITSRSGQEQRRALRQTPRKSIEFLATCADERWRALVQTFNVRQGSPMLLAEIPQGVRSVNAMGVGGNSFQVPVVRPWMAPGQKVILADGDRMRERTVQLLAGSTLTFVEATTNAWPVGTRICPALLGRLPDTLAAQQHLPRVGEATVPFIVEPGSEMPRDPGLPTVTWNGREVFTAQKPNWINARDVTYERDVQTIDYGTGRTQTFLPVAFGSTIRTADYLVQSVDDANGLLAFFERQKGQRGEFYVPTDNADVILAAPTSNAFLFVDGGDFAAAYAADPVAKALSFRMADGTRFYRRVTGLTVQGGQSRIQLDTPVPYQISAANVEVISWLPVLRNATDDLTIEWHTDTVATARFTYRTLPAATAEIP